MSIEIGVMAYVSAKLLADPAISALVGTRVIPQHHSTIENPSYPLITYELLASPDDRLVVRPIVAIEVWSVKSALEAWTLEKSIRKALTHRAGSATNARIINARRVFVTGTVEGGTQRLHHVVAHYQFNGIETQ